jgi:transposase
MRRILYFYIRRIVIYQTTNKGGGFLPLSNYQLFVGVDWATEEHQICVIDPERRLIENKSIQHSGLALLELADWLSTLAGGVTASVGVAIETPRGAIVETLVERGFHVYAINPKQLDRFRDRHTVAGAKDDRLDALVLADSLRTDQHCFRLVQIDDPLTIQLRELSRVEDDLRDEAVRLTNRLRDQIHRYYPQMLKLCANASEPWLWALWEVIPSPACLKGLRASRVEKVLRSHRIRRIKAPEVLVVLKEPPLHVAPGAVEAATTHIKLLLPQLRLIYEQRQSCAERIEQLLDQLPVKQGPETGPAVVHRDVDILRSLPGVGRIVCSTLLAEGSQHLRARDYHNFRALAGVAPVTRQTGKQGKPGSGRRVTVLMRRACNLRIRNAVYHWARISSQCDEASRHHYAALRQRGHRHGRALRGVADRLLRILFAMLRTGTLYKPAPKTPHDLIPNPNLPNP